MQSLEEWEALPPRKLTWVPTYQPITMVQLNELMQEGWATSEELSLWASDQLPRVRQRQIDNQLALLALDLTTAPIQ